MSTPNPTHIITEHLRLIEDDLGNQWPINPEEIAAIVVSKLTDAGYSIVQLPTCEKDHNGDRYFDGVSYQVNDRGVLLKHILLDGTWKYAEASTARVKAHALQLLAAAAAAEEDQ